jgi:hypothetical protein
MPAHKSQMNWLVTPISILAVLFACGGSGSRQERPAIPAQVATEALRFCRSHRLDTSIAFLFDAGAHSGRKRFFIYDLQKRRAIRSGLVCHGMGGNSTCEEPRFSNRQGSNCTSLGKYRTGARAYSRWGIHVHYKLHGLEPTNSNAFDRIVVLHSYDPVPDQEIYPAHLPMGWSLGCPVISNSVMSFADSLLQRSNRPLLLWVYARNV